MVKSSPIKVELKFFHDIGIHSFCWLKSFKLLSESIKTKSEGAMFQDKNKSKIKFCKNDLVCSINSADFEKKAIWY